MSELQSKVKTATKWSAATEILAKLATPISGMIMARLLTPEAYGAMAAISIIITFTELFSDVGFKKYIIQHEFETEKEKLQSTNVAFWTNLFLSLLFWIVIIIFRDSLASLVGSPELGTGIAVACMGIPISAFSSLQTALYQRAFDFKTLFYTKIVSILVPFVVTIPLAFLTRNYWALIIGGLVSNSLAAIILTIKSSWKPKLFYSFEILRKMFAFCMWLLIDSILVWSTSYIDVFLISRGLDEHFLGLYRTSTNIVGQILAIVTSVIFPVLLPALSRLQNDYSAMRAFLLKLQKYTALILLPIAFDFWIYRDLFTTIVLGQQWMEAADFIGIWGAVSVIMIVLSRFCTYVFPAVGKPKFSIISQILHLVVLVPTTIIAVDYGFEALYWTRSLVRLQALFVDFVLVYLLIKLSAVAMIKNILPEFIASIVMCIVSYLLLAVSNHVVWMLLTCVISAITYGLILFYFVPKDKILMIETYHYVIKKFKSK